ncbi:MAG: hypothetical protein HKO66_11980, partial [Saprospiraceae bacterium]|nr:hypothetical protein [Saprospiraceae bacterium]
MKSMLFLLLTFVFCSFQSCSDEVQIQDTEIELPTLEPDTIRFAVYNVSMFGSSEGLIASQLENADQYIRFKRIASVIQKVSPDVLVLMEFDYDSTGNALRNFNDQLLAVSQNGDSALIYPYTYQIDSNTGELSSVDIDGNGSITLPNDAYGFGQFKGQYASAILSTYPLDTLNSRSFRKFLWKDMPNAA